MKYPLTPGTNLLLPRGHYKSPPRQTATEVMMVYEQIRSKFGMATSVFSTSMSKPLKEMLTEIEFNYGGKIATEVIVAGIYR